MSTHTRIKICGITRLDDALFASRLGVDALGFVFCTASSRAITPEDAARITDRLPPFIVRVGLFLNAERDEVLKAFECIPNLLPQFHGTESADWCESFNRPYLKALGVADGLPDATELADYRRSQGFLFDSNAPGELGGTGHAFDWNRLEGSAPEQLILAGGLYPENVESAVRQVRPYAVDVSSGVERAKGVKDEQRMQTFVNAVRRADKSRA